jgi:plasmid stability protein
MEGLMSNLVILDVDDWVMERLSRRAEAHGQAPALEAKAILQEALGQPPVAGWRQVNAIRDSLAAAGKVFSDSTELIREDRNR